MRGRAACRGILALLAALLAFGSCRARPEEVRIGLIAMLSGDNQSNGRVMSDAARLAISEAAGQGFSSAESVTP